MKASDDYWRGREGGRVGKNKRWWAKQGADAYAEYQRKQRVAKPDQYRVYDLTAYRLHRDEKIANGRRYRARKLGVGGDITPADIEVMWTAQDGRCFYCREMLAKGYHLDHKVPLSRGGGHVPENGCLSCASCNHRKHTLTADEFVARLATSTA
jgi:5-methylcytosine-specific restriction endonuclease McrA